MNPKPDNRGKNIEVDGSSGCVDTLPKSGVTKTFMVNRHGIRVGFGAGGHGDKERRMVTNTLGV